MKHRYVISAQSLQKMIKDSPSHFELVHIYLEDEEARIEIHVVNSNGIIDLKHSLSILASETAG